MSQNTKLSTEVLKIHPRNQEFFDDIEGEDYERFKMSIEEEGIIVPLIIAPDMTIVAGHQRLKAAKDLGIRRVPVIIREDLDDEDEKLKKLLATNFGRIKNDPAKQRKVAVQYVELCGLRKGDNQYSIGENRRSLTQKEIANNLGIPERTLRELLEIERKLTPEIKELLDEGIISKTAASKIWTKLSEEEQLELLEELGKDKIANMTTKQTQEEVDKWKNSYKEVKQAYDDLVSEKERLELQISRLKNKPSKIIDKTDYTRIKKLESSLSNLKKQMNKINQEKSEYHDKYIDSLNELKEEQEKVSKFMGNSTSFELVKSTSELTSLMISFLRDMSKYDYLAESFNDLPNSTRKEYVRSIFGVYKWARNILNEVKTGDVVGVNTNIIDNVNYKEVVIDE